MVEACATTSAGFDPAQDVRLDAAGLRALAHPLRVRLLGRLRLYGPATAVPAGPGPRRVLRRDELPPAPARSRTASSSRTTERGTRRERWCRAAHRSTHFDLHLGRRQPGDRRRVPARGGPQLQRPDAPLRRHRRDSVETTTAPSGPTPWTLSDWQLDLTGEQATRAARGTVRPARPAIATGPRRARAPQRLVAQVAAVPDAGAGARVMTGARAAARAGRAARRRRHLHRRHPDVAARAPLVRPDDDRQPDAHRPGRHGRADARTSLVQAPRRAGGRPARCLAHRDRHRRRRAPSWSARSRCCTCWAC